MTTIEDFLRSANLLKAKNGEKITYLEAFKNEGIEDLETLFEYEDDELYNDCHFKKGHWKKFLKYKKDHSSIGESDQIGVSNTSTGDSTSQRNLNNKKTKRELFDPTKSKQVSIAFLGMTGAGKTTLLASLRDYIDGKSYDEILSTLKWEEEHAINENFKTRKDNGSGESRTKVVTTYPCKNKEWNVRIIDTPGLADTNGLEVDQKHAKNLINGLAKASQFNALCIVLKNSDNRKTAQLEYVVNELLTNFPKSIRNNIIIMVTGCSSYGISTETEKILEELNLPTKYVVTIENKAYSTINMNNLTDKQIKSEIRGMKFAYEESHDRLQSLLEIAYSLKPYKSKEIDDLRMKKEKLNLKFGEVRSIMESCIKQQILIDKKRKEINTTKLVLQNLQNDENKKEKQVEEKLKEFKKLETGLNQKIKDVTTFSTKLQNEEDEISRLQTNKNSTDVKIRNMSISLNNLINKRNAAQEERDKAQTELGNTIRNIGSCESNIRSLITKRDTNKNYTTVEEKDEIIKEPCERQTFCSNCTKTCHNPCYLTGQGIDGCSCIDNHTRSCTTCDCHSRFHHYRKFLTKNIKTSHTSIDYDKKKLYEDAVKELKTKNECLEKLKRTKTENEKTLKTRKNVFDNLVTEIDRANMKTKKENLENANTETVNKISKLEETKKLLKKEKTKLEVEKVKLQEEKLLCDKDCQKLKEELNNLINSRKSRECDINRLEKNLLELQNDYNKSKKDQEEAENNVAKIYIELEKIAILGYNSSYYKYIQTMIQSIKK